MGDEKSVFAIGIGEKMDLYKFKKKYGSGDISQEELEVFLKDFVGTYIETFSLNLLFELYLLLETGIESEHNFKKQVLSDVRGFIKKIADLDFEDADLVDNLKESILIMREKNISLMENYTQHTDALMVYQNALELKEYSLKDDSDSARQMAMSIINSGMLYEKITGFFNSGKDKADKNERLRQLLSFIPVRITKTKLLDIVEKRLSVCEGASMDALKNFEYMVKSACLFLDINDTDDDKEKEIRNIINDIKGKDIEELSAEECAGLLGTIDDVADTISVETDYYYSLQTVINLLYSLILVGELNGGYNEKQREELMFSFSLCEENTDLLDENFVKIMDNYANEFEKMKTVVDKNIACTAILAKHEKIQNNDYFKKVMNCFELCNMITGSGKFADIESDEVQNASKSDVEKTYKEVENTIEKAFSDYKRIIRKQIVKTLFRSLDCILFYHDDLEGFFNTHLFNCNNRDEKEMAFLQLNEYLDEGFIDSWD